MHNFSRAIIAALIILGLAFPAVSLSAPSGNAQEDQYVEQIPDKDGGNPSGASSGNGPGDSAGAGVSPGANAVLIESGPDGNAVAELAGGERVKGGSKSENAASSVGAAAEEPLNSGDSSVVDSISQSVDSLSDSEGGGLGVWLVVIIAAVAIGGIAFVLSRGRAGTSSS